MKYKLINSVSKIETICDKVTIDGFDYYVSDDKAKDIYSQKVEELESTNKLLNLELQEAKKLLKKSKEWIFPLLNGFESSSSKEFINKIESFLNK